jgi:hypothetical protein
MCSSPYGQRRNQFSIVTFHRLERISLADSAFLHMSLTSGDYLFYAPDRGRVKASQGIIASLRGLLR